MHLLSGFKISLFVPREQREGEKTTKRDSRKRVAVNQSSLTPQLHHLTTLPCTGQEQPCPCRGLNISDISRAPESEVSALIFVAISSVHYAPHDLFLSVPSGLVVWLKERLARRTYMVILQIQYAESEMQ